MTAREKLIELFQCCPRDIMGNCGIGKIADHLLANGVTVQQWIPVTERLPEIGCNVLVVDRVTGGVATAHLNGFAEFVFSDGRGHGASHWMPLTEPPKN